LFDLPKFGDGICLARMADLLDLIAIDRAWLQRVAVVITGSNGKGSTAAFCAAIGRALGLRTGLFTSPHLYRVNERFQVDGTPIGDPELIPLVARVGDAIAGISAERNERFGRFEAMFALACLHFQERGCDFAVFEAGIGGRYDPVRLVGARTTCITSVDYEHVELLGTSLELIVSDKSDACASGGTIVIGENCRGLRPHLSEYLRNRAVSTLFVRDQIGIAAVEVAPPVQRFDYRFAEHGFDGLEMRLLGAFQFNNAAIAITMLLIWLSRTHPERMLPEIEAAVRSGLRKARWPGRLEVIRSSPLAVIDVGHTPDAVRQALASLKAIHGADRWILVLGVSFDKKAGEIVEALAPAFDTIICTAARHKGMGGEKLACAVREANPAARVQLAPTIEEAVELSQVLAAAQGGRIYAAGGLFLAVEYANISGGGDARDLAFL
jgi:dihydrofolate synthase / folylpolyglutamate synthase